MHLREQIFELITDQHMTSIEFIAAKVGCEEEEVSTIITQLVETGELIGEFSEDGTRFYSESPNFSSGRIVTPAPFPSHRPKEKEFDCAAFAKLFSVGISLVSAGSLSLYNVFAANVSGFMKFIILFVLMLGILICLIDLIYLTTGWFPFYDRLTHVKSSTHSTSGDNPSD